MSILTHNFFFLDSRILSFKKNVTTTDLSFFLQSMITSMLHLRIH